MLQVPPSSFRLLPSFAKIVCEPGWKWPRREKPMANYDLFYVWSGEGELLLNRERYEIGPGSCFLFRPGDYTSATHNPQRPLVLTYIDFAVEHEVQEVPLRYRVLEERVEFEHLLSRYVRLFLVQTYAAEEEAQLILKQLMIRLLRSDRQPQVERKASNQLTEAIQEIANFIRQNPGISHRVEDLAGRAGLSPRYFSIKFKELIGNAGADLYDPHPDRESRASADARRHECHRGRGLSRLSGHLLFQQTIQAIYGQEPVRDPVISRVFFCLTTFIFAA